MPIAKVGSIGLYYETHGHGEPVVLIMGLGGGGSMWWHQVASLSQEYRVVTYDHRGVGRSDQSPGPYTMQMFVDDVTGLMDHLGIGIAHVYGLSMGGMIAQQLALDRPGRVSSLVLGATCCGGTHSLLPSPETVQVLARIAEMPAGEAMEATAQAILGTSSLPTRQELVKEIMKRGAECPPSRRGLKGQMEALAFFDVYERLHEVKVPALILAGTEDVLMPPENSRLLASLIPSAEIVLIEEAGHCYIWEVPEKADAIVLDFLRRHSLPGQAEVY